ncbi:MAG: glycoside hydrolase, partial [Terrimonas sp.]|nr:glycoside hydrolase [Terrimonas sp.]
RGLKKAELDSIPEMPAAYPEFSQFKELPAWGFYLRHAEDINFKNITLIAGKKEYRPAIVADDVKNISFEKVEFQEPDSRKKKQVFLQNSTQVKKK